MKCSKTVVEAQLSQAACKARTWDVIKLAAFFSYFLSKSYETNKTHHCD